MIAHVSEFFTLEDVPHYEAADSVYLGCLQKKPAAIIKQMTTP
jgi:hypothetical protein